MPSIYRAGEIDLFENLDIVHIRLLVVVRVLWGAGGGCCTVKPAPGPETLLEYLMHKRERPPWTLQ